MIVLDSNILVYAVGRDHALRDHCRAIVAAIRDGIIEATTTIGMIDEFLHVHAKSRGRAEAVQVAEDYLALLSPLLVVEEADLRPAFRLFERVDGLDVSDAVLAAAAIRADAQALISADQAFGRVPRLRHVDPTGESLDGLLAEDA